MSKALTDMTNEELREYYEELAERRTARTKDDVKTARTKKAKKSAEPKAPMEEI